MRGGKIKMEEENCQACGLCCKLFLINLNEEEYRSGRYVTQLGKFGFFEDFAEAEMYGANIVEQKADGSCKYLEGTKCSIHQTRPQVCRGFFCNSQKEDYQGMIKDIEEKRAELKSGNKNYLQ